MSDQTIPKRRSFPPAAVISQIVMVVRKALAGGTRSRHRMNVIETLQLGGKRQLILVRCDEHDYLVGAGSEGVHSIAKISEMTTTTGVGLSDSDEGVCTFAPVSGSVAAGRTMRMSH